MTLQEYGVLLGTIVDHSYYTAGNWPHFHLGVQAPGRDGALVRYDCAVDVKSSSNSLVMARFLHRVQPSDFSAWSLPDGYHRLASNAASGALDYARHPAFAEGALCRSDSWFARAIAYYFGFCPQWITESGDNLANEFPNIISRAKRVAVFGAPYTDGTYGMHDIHMNQGDPNPSTSSDPHAAQFWGNDGIWQDGGLLLQYEGIQRFPRGRTPPWRTPYFMSTFAALEIRFSTQTLRTGNDGHPL